jgi:HK97 family phage prohead protease
MTTLEMRHTSAPVEVRAAGDGLGSVGGYALKWMRYSQNLGGFVEQVGRSAVAKSLADGVDVLARYNHDDNMLLGRTSSGTLSLREDDEGLDYDVRLPDTQPARDLYALASRGDVSQSSFAFYTMDEEWSLTETGFPVRTLLSVRLVDVAPANTPAYLDTSSAVRSLAHQINADPSDIPALVERGEVAQRLATPLVIDLAPAATEPRRLLRARLDLEAKRLP